MQDALRVNFAFDFFAARFSFEMTEIAQVAVVTRRLAHLHALVRELVGLDLADRLVE